jgi:urease subunit alpha
MFGTMGLARKSTGVTFVSKSALDDGIGDKLKLQKTLVAVRGTRSVRKRDMIHNQLTPNIEVDPQNYQVRIDGQLLTCEPADVLPMAQRYFLF